MTNTDPGDGADKRRLLAEIRHFLNPGGTFRFIEHVRAEGGAAAGAQRRAGGVARRPPGIAWPVWVFLLPEPKMSGRRGSYCWRVPHGLRVLGLPRPRPDGT